MEGVGELFVIERCKRNARPIVIRQRLEKATGYKFRNRFCTHEMFVINSMRLQKSIARYGDVLCFFFAAKVFHTNNQEILIVV